MSVPARLTIRIVCAVTLLAAIGGCTTLRPVDLEIAQLREEIRVGNVVRPGERIRVTTESGDVREFRLEAVHNDSLVGDGVTVPIGEITALEAREHSAGKTAGAVFLGTSAVMWILISALLSVMVLPGI